MRIRSLAGIISVALLTAAEAGNFFVAPSGSDANPGTEELPWKTIQHAAHVLLPGDTAYVRAGVYRERVAINVSGSESAGPVVLANYPGEVPILDAQGLAAPSG